MLDGLIDLFFGQAAPTLIAIILWFGAAFALCARSHHWVWFAAGVAVPLLLLVFDPWGNLSRGLYLSMAYPSPGNTSLLGNIGIWFVFLILWAAPIALVLIVAS